MITMQVADEDVVDEHRRNLHRQGVLDTAVAHVEEETARLGLAVAALHQDAGAGLASCRGPGGAALPRTMMRISPSGRISVPGK